MGPAVSSGPAVSPGPAVSSGPAVSPGAGRHAWQRALGARQAKVIGGHLPHVRGEPFHGRRERRPDQVAGGFHARRHHGRHAVAPGPAVPLLRPGVTGLPAGPDPFTGPGPFTGSGPFTRPGRRVPPVSCWRRASGTAASLVADLAGWPTLPATASPWRRTRAAFKPLRTAPSIVSGHPVSVQAPASTSPGRAVAAPGRSRSHPGTWRSVARRSLVTKKSVTRASRAAGNRSAMAGRNRSRKADAGTST